MDIDEKIGLDALFETKQKLEIMRGLQDVAIKMLTDFYGTNVCTEEAFAGLARGAFINAKELVENYAVKIASELLVE